MMDALRRSGVATVTMFGELITAIDGRAAERGLPPVGDTCTALSDYMAGTGHEFRDYLAVENDHRQLTEQLVRYYEWIVRALDHLRDDHPEHYLLIGDLHGSPFMTHIRDGFGAAVRDLIGSMTR